MAKIIRLPSSDSCIIFFAILFLLPKLFTAESKTAEFPASIEISGCKLILVKSGTYTMGSPNLPPRMQPYEGLREVNIAKDFYLGETEVTQSLWEKYIKINPSRFQSPSLPVEGITWKEAMAFCDALNKLKDKWELPEKMLFRLPSEAEWEYAARAGSKSTFFFGEDSSLLINYAWISDNSEGSTKPTGLLKANKLGFLDIYGNVREWCLDGYEAWPSGKLTSPLLGWKNLDKVNRGGSWDSCDACCKTAKRINYGENYQSSDIGFRLAFGYPFPEMIKE